VATRKQRLKAAAEGQPAQPGSTHDKKTSKKVKKTSRVK